MCRCLQGHTGNDCSTCAIGCSSSLKSSEDLQSGKGTCSNRGVCVDDDLFQRLELAAGSMGPSEVHVLRGTGRCSCNADIFGEECSQGECSAGQEPTLDLTSRSTLCRTCLQGTGKEQMGNQACGTAPTSASSAMGRYQAQHRQAACLLCEAGDGSDCQQCVRGTFDKGFYQPTPGQAECLQCDAGKRRDDGRTSRAGGFVAINRKLLGEINLVLENMLERFTDDLTTLTSQLHERDAQDEDLDSSTVPEQQGTSEATAGGGDDGCEET